MARLPWVSRGMHLEVIAAKNEVIHQLQRQVASLEELLKNPAPVQVKVEMPVPSPVEAPHLVRRAKPLTEEKEEPQDTDWSKIDTGNAEVMARLAIKEFGGIPQPHVLARWQQQVTNLARAARLKQTRNAATRGETGTITAPSPATEEEAQQQGPQYVPAHVRELISAAERAS